MVEERALTIDLLIIHGVVVTMDAQRRIFADGAVAIKGSQIVAVGPSAQSVAVDTVIVGGEIILENGCFKRVNEEAEYRRIDRAARELYQRMGWRDQARWPVL